MVQYYTIITVLALCIIIMIFTILHRRKVEEEKRRQLELLAAKRHLEESRDQLKLLDIRMSKAEETCKASQALYETKKSELLHAVSQLQEAEEEKKSILEEIEKESTENRGLHLLTKRLQLNEEKLSQVSQIASEAQQELDNLKSSFVEKEEQFMSVKDQMKKTSGKLDHNRVLIKKLEEDTKK